MNKKLRKLYFILVLVFCLMVFDIHNVYAEELISDIIITGLEKPDYKQRVYERVAGIKIPENANYTIDEIIWWCDDNRDGMYEPLDFDDFFVGVRNYYRYEVVLKVKEGFKFSTNTDIESGYLEFSGNVSTSNIGYEIASYNNDGTLSIVGEVFNLAFGFLSGAEQEVITDSEAEFEIDADYSLFENGGQVYVDDETTPLDSSNYTSKSGSTIITLNKEYVSTLSEGEHTLIVVFNNDNSATTTFTVEKSTPTEETNTETNTNTNNNVEIEILPPNTGIHDSTTRNDYASYVFILLGLSGIILVAKKEN